MSRGREGGWAWLALAALVAAYDTWAISTGRETMSAAFARALECPTRRPLVLTGWAALTAHLLRWIPPAGGPPGHPRRSPGEAQRDWPLRMRVEPLLSVTGQQAVKDGRLSGG